MWCPVVNSGKLAVGPLPDRTIATWQSFLRLLPLRVGPRGLRSSSMHRQVYKNLVLDAPLTELQAKEPMTGGS